MIILRGQNIVSITAEAPPNLQVCHPNYLGLLILLIGKKS